MTLSKSCNNPNPTIIKRRILILSLEFNYSPFSGNGVLSRSIGSSLARRDDCTVRVICAKPHPATPDISNDIEMSIFDNDQFEIWPVELPRQCKWKRLDREGPWNEFATNACNYANNVKDYQPTDVIAVDWHGMLAWRAISIGLFSDDSDASSGSWYPTNVKVCYYNFRVYSNSDYADDIKSFYQEKEQLSCQMSNVIICLSEHDRLLIQKLIDDDDSKSLSKQKIHILYPPLRGDIYNLAMNMDQSNISSSLPHDVKAVVEKVSSSRSKTNKRMFITCMARLSPEKSPHNFVALLHKLGGVEFLRKNSLIPILCGAKSVDEYANKVINDFKALCLSDGEAWPYIVITRHLNPEELAAVFSSTVINVHPCLYDAYGMTIIESGAFGVTSIVNGGGKVGATSLLGEGTGCLAINLETILDLSDKDAKRCDDIRTVLGLLDNKHDIETKSDGVSLKRIAKEAKSKALGWDEAACCLGLIDILNGLNA